MSRNTLRKSPERPSECSRRPGRRSVRTALTYRIAIVPIIINDKLLSDSKVLHVLFNMLLLSLQCWKTAFWQPPRPVRANDFQVKIHSPLVIFMHSLRKMPLLIIYKACLFDWLVITSLPFRVKLSCSGPFTRGLLRIGPILLFYPRFNTLVFYPHCHDGNALWKLSVLLIEKQLNKQLYP